MTNLGDRRYVNPVLVKSDGSAVNLKRIPLDRRAFDEGWLQELIRKTPSLLPVGEIEPAFAPMISVGRELETGAGFIDNMFLSPQGYLTIVETKLWRNPEARREVVGQIIEYATRISRWSFQELEAHVRKYNERYLNSKMGILDSIRLLEEVDEGEEQFIVDTIIRSLRQGRFLLLIVGDGIRESVEAMAEFLHQTPHLFFTLALVELQVYAMDEKEHATLLVVPQIVARTREITRAVVRVEGSPVAVQVAPPETTPGVVKPSANRSRFTLTEDDFFAQLSQSVGQNELAFAKSLIDDMTSRGCIIDWKQGSFVVKYPDPGGSGQKVTLFVVTKKGQVYTGWISDQVKALNLPLAIAAEFIKNSSRVLHVGVSAKNPNSEWSKPLPLGQLRQNYEEFAAVVQKTIDAIVAASESTTE